MRLLLLLAALPALGFADPQIAAITSVSPTAVDAGGPGFNLTVNGTAFVASSVVNWGGTALATAFVSSNQVTATVPAALIATNAAINITVTNPGNQVSNTARVSVNPVLTALTPNSLIEGGIKQITLSGIGFTPSDSVVAVSQFGPSDVPTTFVSPTTLTASLGTVISSPGTFPIHVAAPGSLNSGSLPLTVVPFTITQIAPSGVPVGSPDFTLTVSGTNFEPADTVSWIKLLSNGGSNSASFPTTFVSSTQLQAAVPSSMLTTVGSLIIVVGNGGAGSNQVNFSIFGGPTISDTSPARFLPGNPSFTLTVHGSGFAQGATVFWNGTALTTTFVDAGTLTAFLPSSLTLLSGAFTITVTNPGGLASTNSVTVHIDPLIYSISPNVTIAGGPGITLTVTGAGFIPTDKVVFSQPNTPTSSGTPLPTTYVNSTTLTAVVPPAQLTTAIVIAVSVYDSASGSQSFQVGLNIAAPVVTQVSPTTVTAGNATFTLSVAGSYFVSGTVVKWNGAALPTSYVDSGHLTAVVANSLVKNYGNATVTVSNPGNYDSNQISFSITPGPFISLLTPAAVNAGAAAFTLTVTGAAFDSSTQVQWNGTPLPTTFISVARLSASVPASLVAADGTANVTAVLQSGIASNIVPFTVNAAPVITSLSPSTLPAGGAAFTLTVNGSNFVDGAVVAWAGTPLVTTFGNASKLTAAVPSSLIATPANIAVTVSNPGGGSSVPANFVAAGASLPTASSLNPSSVIVGAPAFTLVVSGTNFDAAASVTWNGTALPTTFSSSTSLAAAVPAALVAVAGNASVTVVNPGGLSSGTLVFLITAPQPATTTAGIVNVASSLPAIAPGSVIAIYGANLSIETGAATGFPLPLNLAGTSITINGIDAPLLFTGPGQINAQVPYEIKAGTTKLIITSQLGKSAAVVMVVAATGPGVFVQPDGHHVLAANDVDGSMNTAAQPAKPGEYITIYAVGQGALDNSVPTGAAAPASPYSLPLAPVSVTIGGQPVTVPYAGMAPGFAGLMQLNLVIPSVPAGDQQLIVTIGGVASNITIVSIGQ